MRCIAAKWLEPIFMVRTFDNYESQGQWTFWLSCISGHSPLKHLRIEIMTTLECNVPENNFEICFLLEIPLRGFPFQSTIYETYRMPNNNTYLHCSEEFIWKGSPLRGISGRRDIANILSSSRNLKTFEEHVQTHVLLFRYRVILVGYLWVRGWGGAEIVHKGEVVTSPFRV